MAATGLPEFQRLFRTFERSAWRWECQGVYHEPEEREPLRRFLAGEPPEDSWQSEFLALVRSTTAAGKTWARVRQMTVPLTDYLRFEMDLALRGNIPAGEDIRVIWPEEAATLGLPGHDFWLFDDETVARMYFGTGGLDRVEVVTGSSVEQYRRWQRLAWDHAHPAEEYSSLRRT
ncbi:hypothetical protein ORV05_05095 [Amycolatopsis cynarae]|uniref:DUF6879 domain-containing protein n=1 Tax=Amycolatopsis cynarae TaxID=2995223 RepID=A0ABY7B5G1_9PSEU|nr:DUF6879 family protein [Amycolatopsis sp. HUAS 11-8]WAL67169.1 hypothetical protein ORV05_05095 [Amycolatopsis sp. HUAS 11-8]